jgi:hypothetical protein
MIDKSKTYRTRDGREVRIYATDGGSYQPIMGATSYTSKEGKTWWESARWADDGSYDPYGRETNSDLIEVRPRHKRTVWVNVYGPESQTSHHSREQADEERDPECLACIRVDLNFEEGEGL